MGNSSSLEDEEYEDHYQGKLNGKSNKNMTEYEGLLHNDKLKAGAILPVEENGDHGFIIKVKKCMRLSLCLK